MRGRGVRLTDAGVGKLKPDTTEYAVWDSEVPGLGVRVRPSGHRSFVWHGRVQGEPVRTTVGPAALMTVEDARKRALALSVGNAPRKRSSVPLFRAVAHVGAAAHRAPPKTAVRSERST